VVCIFQNSAKQTEHLPASTQRPDKGSAGLTLADLVPVSISQAWVAQGLDEGQVLLEALQFAPQVGQHLSCRPSHGLPNLGCLPIPATPHIIRITIMMVMIMPMITTMIMIVMMMMMMMIMIMTMIMIKINYSQAFQPTVLARYLLDVRTP